MTLRAALGLVFALVAGLVLAYFIRRPAPSPGSQSRVRASFEGSPARPRERAEPVPWQPQPQPQLTLPSEADLPVPRRAPAEPQVAPAKAGHDAIAALKFRGGGGADVVALFREEPRDPTWAPEREADIASQALSEFLDADRDARMEVECHAATCRVRIHSRQRALTEQLWDYPLACLANSTVPLFGVTEQDADDPYSDFYMVFGAETRDRDGFIARRDNTCQRYRDRWRQAVLRAPR